MADSLPTLPPLGVGPRPRPTPAPLWVAPAGRPALAAVPQPPVINYPTPAQQMSLNQMSLPGAWGNWFASVYGPLAEYYTPERGAPTQAQYDYAGWRNVFAQTFGRPPTPDVFAGVLDSYRQWALTRNQPVTFAGLLDFTTRMYSMPPRPPMVSFLRMSSF